MSSNSYAFANGRLTEKVNQEFGAVRPGFLESSEAPVMWTPVLVPAAVVATQASCFSAFC